MYQSIIRDPGGTGLIRIQPDVCGQYSAIVNGSILIVPPGTTAFVAINGTLSRPYGPGRYEIFTGVDPFFVRLRNILTRGDAGTTVSVFFVSTERAYCPFTFCERAGCDHCTVAIREEANMYAEQIFAERHLKLNTPEEIAAHIVRIPSVLSFRINDGNETVFKKKCECIAVHLLRKCSMENGISFSLQTVTKLLSEMNKQGEGGTGNE